jgi:hypothetical protein
MKTRQPGLIFIPPTVEAINFLESYDYPDSKEKAVQNLPRRLKKRLMLHLKTYIARLRLNPSQEKP